MCMCRRVFCTVTLQVCIRIIAQLLKASLSPCVTVYLMMRE